MSASGNYKDVLLNWARQAMLENENLVPLLVLPEEKKALAVVGNWVSPEQRSNNLLVCGRQLAGNGVRPKEVILITTGWMVGLEDMKPSQPEPVAGEATRIRVLLLVFSTGHNRHEVEMQHVQDTLDGPVFRRVPLTGKVPVNSALMDAFWRGNSGAA
ncbi:MAG: hypothetical protein Q8O40_00330 [Chloroflexota bacterium]|nr:hypothetical protein [Chloroflexota bacterium]